MAAKSEVQDAPVIPRVWIRYEATCESGWNDREAMDDCGANAGAEATSEDLGTDRPYGFSRLRQAEIKCPNYLQCLHWICWVEEPRGRFICPQKVGPQKVATRSRRMIQCWKSCGRGFRLNWSNNDDSIQRRISSDVNSTTVSVMLGSGCRWKKCLKFRTKSHGKVEQIPAISLLLKLVSEDKHEIWNGSTIVCSSSHYPESSE